jgi:hypothetical protein
MTKDWYESKRFIRFLEIIPGVFSWSFIFMPILLAFISPVALGILIMVYSIAWLLKAINISRHLVNGFFRLRKNMKMEWLKILKKTNNVKTLEDYWQARVRRTRKPSDRDELLRIKNLGGRQDEIKNWKDIVHVVVIAVASERRDIIEPTLNKLLSSNYPAKNIIIVLAVEARFKVGFKDDIPFIERKYAHRFKDFHWYMHELKSGEVVGKGSNISCAGHAFWKEYKNKGIAPDNILVTTLDADHVVHSEYFSRLTYLYVIDPNRHNKTYQPIPLLFNNIWDVPATNRIAAVSTSFWQLIEGMRSYKLRTFAAHAQSMETLLKTDFWAVHTIVEDGHQYWRTYFAFDGDAQIVPMYIPVYQDAVLGENLWQSVKNQYKQIKRWSWGVTDFPFVVINSIKHKEIPLFERILQIYRQFISFFTWASASFFLATSWIPLALSQSYQDTAFAHNSSFYASKTLQIAWFGVFLNYWLSLFLFPPKPKHYGIRYNIEMIFQWVLAPIYAIIILSLPALETQTRLIFNKRIETFWVTPKIRKSELTHLKEK